MVGLKRRRKYEGWALDDSELNDESRHIGIFRRLADNNKLWVGCLIAILLTTAFLYRNAKQDGQIKRDVEIHRKASGAYNDKDHRDFSRNFLLNKKYGALVSDARFIGPETFRLTIRGTSSADDIDYVSKLAAQKILNSFKTRAVVRTYAKRSGNNAEILIATAQWEPKKFGFVVKFNRDAK